MSGCCVYGCRNRCSTGGLKFYRIPKGSQPFQSNRRRLWLQAIKRVDRNEDRIKTARVCSATLYQALCGCTVKAPTLDKRTVSLPLQDVIIRPGMKQRITGEGLPLPKSSDRRGYLIVEFEVKFPERLSRDAKDTVARVLPS
ncbi:dnaJ homolog subfamily B member 1-like isoform X2 [Neoarius graeffei]|uniref:dnaJ homolog subfamily B member 1-like isoform X2 n=1 Tax=Neoarius graeffei TaxID=443677 RepID=UPI00298C01C0|nr:dnaJ homolog subfamily B member 1-like isoform X2 [Neoarius graeffei]